MIDFIELIIKNAKEEKQRIAYLIGNESITYGELLDKALVYAEYLKRQGNKPIILYGHKSIEFVISIISCLLSKRTYIPIDTCTPISRLKKIRELSDASLLIYFDEFKADFVESCHFDDLKKYKDNKQVIIKNSIAYIIFTSGSTGVPKGVPISYTNLDNFCKWIGNIESLCEYKHINVLNQASFSFDLSVADFYYALCYSHTLIGIDIVAQDDFEYIFNTLQKKNINLMVVTPTFIKLCLLNKDFNSNNFNNLKCIYFCGECLEIKTASLLFERFPNIKIINAYGPTEATSAVSSILITKKMLSSELLPVGNMKTNATNIEIINDEIVLKGPSVFNGYLGNEQGGYYLEKGINCYRTGDMGYVENGMLYCKGRIDYQVKYKGYRIELFDIENNLKTLPGVLDAVVVDKKNENGIVKMLKAFVILKDGYELDDIKNKLKEKLPHYMIPKYFRKIDAFPVNVNNKIDRKKLREL